MNVPGLRSPYLKIGRLVYFGRMLDKIRLHAAGKLPAEYIANLGDQQPGMFDTRCCRFLGVSYADIQSKTLSGMSDEEVLAWAEKTGGRRSDEECEVWNGFMMKRGWHDHPDNVARLKRRLAESGLQDQPIETFFDYIDADEGRDPLATRPWQKV